MGHHSRGNTLEGDLEAINDQTDQDMLETYPTTTQSSQTSSIAVEVSLATRDGSPRVAEDIASRPS